MLRRACQLAQQNVRIAQICDSESLMIVWFFSAMLRRWFVEDKGDTYAYQWEENESVVEWMEKQKKNEESTVNRNIYAVRKDAIISRIQQSLEVRTESQLQIRQQRILFQSTGMPGSSPRRRCRLVSSFAASSARRSRSDIGTT